MGQPDMSQLLAHAQAMQSKLQAAQEEILASVVEGDAGNGLVKATIDGTGKLKALEINPEVVDADDIDTLQDLIIGAFNNAHTKLATIAEEKMGPLNQGLDGMGGLF
ncbi:YbaB/EbfC family nucleoid-associated protein [Corynebacterium sp. ES2794-CONJ1]|uniref:YbaB/EbfC family nucleoid-associated protein n=1 Tax=unclassified Corynebacterium TaxID=2624378 RepID=UPI0021688499|nr:MULTISPECIES: YbaB/EbfC family nucleoid-associated protein [unclassified Corynebacterium]MCS4490352.1 YbaB/EbfC family nucleoid-associated protein [Corynebacterium sp. ES2775-CONJ]MCS4492130.1 YbaB/EbfC family nucleoid-associated protein [Corynebacterium sp. ES2715-CONJ3]MCS4532386.1 YbaB/EbfC family nucleoid-associated protein [Corynebacterium sp. ES2730-CONJ]MCU9519651.1 YbaB/EbfC family nucleoid-associated protein [Corynebacterium sp. ES2794-CONJ1]